MKLKFGKDSSKQADNVVTVKEGRFSKKKKKKSTVEDEKKEEEGLPLPELITELENFPKKGKEKKKKLPVLEDKNNASPVEVSKTDGKRLKKNDSVQQPPKINRIFHEDDEAKKDQETTSDMTYNVIDDSTDVTYAVFKSTEATYNIIEAGSESEKTLKYAEKDLLSDNEPIFSDEASKYMSPISFKNSSRKDKINKNTSVDLDVRSKENLSYFPSGPYENVLSDNTLSLESSKEQKKNLKLSRKDKKNENNSVNLDVTKSKEKLSYFTSDSYGNVLSDDTLSPKSSKKQKKGKNSTWTKTAVNTNTLNLLSDNETILSDPETIFSETPETDLIILAIKKSSKKDKKKRKDSNASDIKDAKRKKKEWEEEDERRRREISSSEKELKKRRKEQELEDARKKKETEAEEQQKKKEIKKVGKLTKDTKKNRLTIEALVTERDSLSAELYQLKESLDQRINTLTEQHREILSKATSDLTNKYTQERTQLVTGYESTISDLRSKLQNVQCEHEEEKVSIHAVHAQEMRLLHQQYKDQIDSTVLCHDKEKNRFLDTIAALEQQNDYLEEQLVEKEQTLQSEVDYRVQQKVARYATINAELQSLQDVIDMKNKETKVLRNEVFDLTNKIEDISELKRENMSMRNITEQLEATIAMKTASERNLSMTESTLREELGQRVNETNNLSLKCEELHFKLSAYEEVIGKDHNILNGIYGSPRHQSTPANSPVRLPNNLRREEEHKPWAKSRNRLFQEKSEELNVVPIEE